MTEQNSTQMWHSLISNAGEMLTSYAGNTVDDPPIERIFGEPLWGAAAADDPIFLQFKNPRVVSEHYRLPNQWLSEAKAVISYFLPFSSDIRWANAAPGEPAKEWLFGRYEGEMVNDALRQWLVDYLQAEGFEAVAPPMQSEFAITDQKANWSERHTAFAAGLGTFGIHSSFITAAGCAGRFGSVITTAALAVTERTYTKSREYCGQCGLCIKRCPVRAISRQGKNHALCAAYLKETHEKNYPRYGCGKCQTAVPCEWGIPST